MGRWGVDTYSTHLVEMSPTWAALCVTGQQHLGLQEEQDLQLGS